jgi:hypothetical protein
MPRSDIPDIWRIRHRKPLKGLLQYTRFPQLQKRIKYTLPCLFVYAIFVFEPDDVVDWF